MICNVNADLSVTAEAGISMGCVAASCPQALTDINSTPPPCPSSKACPFPSSAFTITRKGHDLCLASLAFQPKLRCGLSLKELSLGKKFVSFTNIFFSFLFLHAIYLTLQDTVLQV